VICNWRNCDGNNIRDCSTQRSDRCTQDAIGNPLSQFFCGLCEDGICIPHPNITNEEECEETFGCVLANGQVVFTKDENECANMMSCTVKCTGTTDYEECESEEECESTGNCGDDKFSLGM